MPICEGDPWREQYFEGVDCPEDVNVPTEDGDACFTMRTGSKTRT